MKKKSAISKSQHVMKVTKQSKPLTNMAGKVRELKSEDIRAMRPSAYESLRNMRGKVNFSFDIEDLREDK